MAGKSLACPEEQGEEREGGSEENVLSVLEAMSDYKHFVSKNFSKVPN